MIKKILVGVPVYDGMKYCWDKFISSAKKFSYKNYDILVVDNSEGNEFFEEIKKDKTIKVIKDDTQETRKQLRLISSENKIIDYAVKNNYDYILKLDSDVIPPRNVIEELLSCKKDVVSALAVSYFNIQGQNKQMPICWKNFTKEEFDEMKKLNILKSNIKSEKDIRRFLTKEEVKSGELLEVCVPFNGCILIKTDILKDKQIRYGLLNDSNKTSDDIYFFSKLREKGFKLFCYPKLACEHMVWGKYKKEDGKYKNPLMGE